MNNPASQPKDYCVSLLSLLLLLLHVYLIFGLVLEQLPMGVAKRETLSQGIIHMLT